MIVLTFLPRFQPLVISGAKPNTIRKPRKRPVKIGDNLSLRRWTGRPYNSPQEVLREAVCTRLDPVLIAVDRAQKGITTWFHAADLDAFARSDGFVDWTDMRQHFIDHHRIDRGPVSGVMIGWPV